MQNVRTAGYLNGMPSVTVIIFRQPGANIIQTVDSIRSAVAVSEGVDSARHQHHHRSRPHHDDSRLGDDVERTLIISVVLVILVVFIFLRNARATLIPSVAVPVSLIGTFAVMYLLRLQPRQPFADGADHFDRFVVDDAIVVMENISRHLEAGHGAVRGGAEGRERDRIHGFFHQHLADRGFHSDSADGRHCRPAVPRIRR